MRLFLLLKKFANNIGFPYLISIPNSGSFTVGESGAVVYSVLDEKMQNDREIWYMIDSSFITTLPGYLGHRRKIPDAAYQPLGRGALPGSTPGRPYLRQPRFLYFRRTYQCRIPAQDQQGRRTEEPLYIGFFHTGAYQNQLAGYGGIKHCMIPSPKHVVVEYNKEGELEDWLYAKEQSPQSMLKLYWVISGNIIFFPGFK